MREALLGPFNADRNVVSCRLDHGKAHRCNAAVLECTPCGLGLHEPVECLGDAFVVGLRSLVGDGCEEVDRSRAALEGSQTAPIMSDISGPFSARCPTFTHKTLGGCRPGSNANPAASH